MKLSQKVKAAIPNIPAHVCPAMEIGLKKYGVEPNEFIEDVIHAVNGDKLPLRSLKEFGVAVKGLQQGTLAEALSEPFCKAYFRAYNCLRRNPFIGLFKAKFPKAGTQWAVCFITTMLDRYMTYPRNAMRDVGDVWWEFVSRILFDEEKWQIVQATTDKKEMEYTNINRMMQRVTRVAEIVDKLILDYVFASASHSSTKESPLPEEEFVNRGNKSFSELPRVTLKELLSNSDLAVNMLEGKAEVSAFIDPTTIPKKYVMIIDQSGSMNSVFYKDYTRFDFALAAAVCLVKNALKGGNDAKIGFFDYTVDPVMKGDDPDLIKSLMTYSAGGGGTSITNALQWAGAEKPEEIIMITDGEDNLAHKTVSGLPCPLTVYSLHDGTANAVLKKEAALFHQVKDLDGKLPSIHESGITDLLDKMDEDKMADDAGE